MTRGHEALKVMARDKFVMNCGAREVDVVAAHAHHFLFVGHRVGGEGNLNDFAAEKERADQLAFGSHHLHAPALTREFGHGDEVVVFDELDRFEGEVANHFRLFAGLDVKVFDVFESFVPVVAVAERARGFLHLVFTPGHFLFADGDDLFRCVRDHLRTEFAD
jgi:hypothetical protein